MVKDRIKLIRTEANLTQEEFGREIGATRGMVTTYEKGTVPTLATRMLICERFNVNSNWLETGEGERYKVGSMPVIMEAFRRMPAVQAALERVLPYVRPEDLDYLNTMVERIISENQKKGC